MPWTEMSKDLVALSPTALASSWIVRQYDL